MVDLSTYAERSAQSTNGVRKRTKGSKAVKNERDGKNCRNGSDRADESPLREGVPVEERVSVNTFVKNTQQSLGIEWQVAVCAVFVCCVYQGYGGDLRRTAFAGVFCVIGMIMWKVRGLSANQPRISVQDGVPAILAMMREHSDHPLWQAEGCKAIYNLCNPASTFTKAQEEHRKTFLSGGVVQCVKNVLQRFPEERLCAQWSAAALTVLYSKGSLKAEENAQIAGEIPCSLLVAAIKIHREQPHVLRRLLVIFGCLVEFSPEYKEEALELGGLEAVLRAMSLCEEVDYVQKWSLWCVQLLIISNELQKSSTKAQGTTGASASAVRCLARSNGLEACSIAITKHTNDVHLQQLGVTVLCLSLLTLGINEEGLTIGFEQGVFPAITVAMEAHPRSKIIQAYGGQMMALVNMESTKELLREIENKEKIEILE